MWTKRISSGTNELPLPKDAINALLVKLISKGSEDAWAHIEVIEERGWFSNRFWGKAPYIEVAFQNKETLQLTYGSLPRFEKNNIPQVPSFCKPDRKHLWMVPISKTTELVEWIDAALVAASARNNIIVTGWLDGL